jgi:molecular chaperone DnaK
MHIGIDLGTTFCCVAYINEGVPQVITDNRGRELTPSVIWFNGKTAYVGEEANKKKTTAYDPIYEFFKRDMGKPTEDVPGKTEKAPYLIDGIKYGAAGISAILLRKLKRDVWQYFKKNKIIEESIKEQEFLIDTIITVPAYFKDEERQATKNAGELAGLNVIGIVNEPTAASLTYGISVNENKRIMVFDLGGGTLDVTVLEIVNGDFNKVRASDGNIQLGGKDWDDVIINYLKNEFKRLTGSEIQDERFYDIQQLAIQAKKDLSSNTETTVFISDNGFDVEIKLYRSANNQNSMSIDVENESQNVFFFDERCSDLLAACSGRCLNVLENLNLSWDDITEIVLAGGSCRMPMITEMLEEISNKKIKKHREGFSYDTAIAIGAAIYGQSKGKIEDVTPASIGIKLTKIENSKQVFYIDHLIFKNTALPAKAKKKYETDPHAILEVYEGESKNPKECDYRGKLELENTGFYASIMLEVDENGILKVLADYQPEGIKETKISGAGTVSQNLKEKIQSLTIIS